MPPRSPTVNPDPSPPANPPASTVRKEVGRPLVTTSKPEPVAAEFGSFALGPRGNACRNLLKINELHAEPSASFVVIET